MNKIPQKKKKERQIDLCKLKEKVKKSMKEIKQVNANKIEEKGTENLFKIICNRELSIKEIFDKFFNLRTNKTENLIEQYSYMRSLYSYLTQLLAKNEIIIKISNEKSLLNINEQCNGVDFPNNSSLIKIENQKIIHLNKEEIDPEIKKDKIYTRIYSLFEKIIKNNDNKILDEFKKIIGENNYQRYINFRKDKSIDEVIVYEKDQYSIKFRRSNGYIYFSLGKKNNI